jgi:hypothetical protein
MLIKRGFISSAAVYPSVALSLRTLETFRVMRLRCPRLGVQAFTRALCDTHGVPYCSYLRNQVSDAFNIYLQILRSVDGRIRSALGWDGDNWRIQNACAACTYKLEGEKPLLHDILFSVDGNTSAKRFAHKYVADTRVFKSDYFVSRDYVNRFKNEVKAKVLRPVGTKGCAHDAGFTQGSNCDPDEGDLPMLASAGQEVEEVVTNVEGYPTNLDSILSVCAERWKANRADEKKGFSGCYDESGIFIAICRHGILLLVCDMIASGEL